jgi:hypothetical protein
VRKSERDYMADLRVDVRIILKYMLNKQDWMVWNGFIWLRTGAISEFRKP